MCVEYEKCCKKTRNMVINTLYETISMSLEIQNYPILVPTIDSPLSGELLIPYSVFKSVEGFRMATIVVFANYQMPYI